MVLRVFEEFRGLKIERDRKVFYSYILFKVNSYVIFNLMKDDKFYIEK